MRLKKLEIFKNNELVDSSLVDVVISKTPYIGSRAIWDINNVDEINYLGTKIWGDLSVNLYPYGYPHGYVSNQIHQYILIFRKG